MKVTKGLKITLKFHCCLGNLSYRRIISKSDLYSSSPMNRLQRSEHLQKEINGWVDELEAEMTLARSTTLYFHKGKDCVRARRISLN